MSVAGKLRIVSALPAVIIAVILGLGAFSYVSAREIRHIAVDASAIEDQAFKLNVLSGDYVRHPDNRIAAQWLEHYDVLKNRLLHMNQHLSVREDVAALMRSADALRETFIQLGEQPAEAKSAQRLLRQVQDTYLLASRMQTDSISRLIRIIWTQIIWALAIILAIGIAILVLTIPTAHAISVSLDALRQGAGRIVSGDLDYRFSVGPNDEFGELARMINGIAASLNDRQRQALDSAAYNRSLLEANLDPMIVINPEGKITDINKAAEDVSGLKRASAIGTYFASYFTTPQQAEAGYREVLSKGFVIDLPLAIRHTSGRITDLLANASLYRDRMGKVAGVFAAAHDVTERKRTEQAMQELNRRLEHSLAELGETQQQVIQAEKLAALGTMAAGIAHELANPLMGVMNYVDDAAERVTDPKIQSVLDNARRALLRMRDLLRGMLNFARPIEEEPALTSVAEIIARTLDLTASEWKTLGISVETDVAADLPPIICKPGGLQQVLLNLLMNARDAVEGRTEKRVRISADRVDQTIRVRVADSGHGIPAQIGQKIFDPFFTTREPGKGTGLGLSISRNTITDMGGSIDFTSTEGEGTVFTVTLPADPSRCRP